MTPDKILEPEWLFPMEHMRVGDSFFIPTLRPAELIYMIDSGSKKAGIKMKSFVASKDGHLGVRSWRVS
jgi:hypothetical protein